MKSSHAVLYTSGAIGAKVLLSHGMSKLQLQAQLTQCYLVAGEDPVYQGSNVSVYKELRERQNSDPLLSCGVSCCEAPHSGQLIELSVSALLSGFLIPLRAL